MIYDVVVIGGGPAGMMAAGRAAENGAKVVLLEKNDRLGVKLLITGKGRCNITNSRDAVREMVNRFGKNGKFLFSGLSRFGVNEIIEFFSSRKLKTKEERGGRVFPVSDRSVDVLKVLKGYLKENKVEVKLKSEIKKIKNKENKIEYIELKSGEKIIADKFIIATGGKSYPETGSTGDGYNWFKKLGHTIEKLEPSLIPILCKEKLIRELEGLSLKNVEISLWQENKKIKALMGEAIFTRNGLSGPIILDLSTFITKGEYKLKIDFKPALEFAVLKKRIDKDFQEFNNKMFKNSLEKLLPKKMIPVFIKLSNIDPEKKVNSITKEEKLRLVHLLKEFELNVAGLGGYDKAIVTKGGVRLSEVDPKTMKSKVVDNLYLAGELLDLNGPTGGYNLQVCWTTGYIAGELN